jgi:hypothetical protein
MCCFYKNYFDETSRELAKRGELKPKYVCEYDGWFKIQSVKILLDWCDDIRDALCEMDAEQGNIANIDELVETKRKEIEKLQKEIDELMVLRRQILPLYPH